MKILFYIVSLLLCVKFTFCAKILAIFSIPSYSHCVLGSTIMKEMNKRGHEITFVSYFKEKEALANWTDIILTAPDFGSIEEITKIHFGQKISFFKNYYYIFYTNYLWSKALFYDQKFQSNLNSSFDLVVYDKFASNIFTALGYHFKCPVVPFSTLSPNIFINYVVGNPHYSSYMPNPYYKLTTFMSLYEKFLNAFFDMTVMLYTHFYATQMENEILQEVIGPLPHLKELLHNVDLFLLNSHHSFHPTIPLLPSMKLIGGAYVRHPKKLPQDIDEFLENSKEGAIYFSMGSVLNSNFLLDEQKEAFVKCFANISQHVLWKIGEKPNLLSKNVRAMEWIPQGDVLSHKNLKVFISHCGQLSIIESIYHGVPLLCIPVFADQFSNSKYVSLRGHGVTLFLDDLTEHNLKDALNEIIQNPSYREKAKFYSSLYHDRPRSPMDEAVYWLEYAIRHKGMPYTKVKSLDLWWYERMYLDIIFTILFIILVYAIKRKIVDKILF